MRCPFYDNIAIDCLYGVDCVYLNRCSCEDIEICPGNSDAWCTEMINAGVASNKAFHHDVGFTCGCGTPVAKGSVCSGCGAEFH